MQNILHVIVSSSGMLRGPYPSLEAAECYREDNEATATLNLTPEQWSVLRGAQRKAIKTRRRIQADNRRTGINF